MLRSAAARAARSLSRSYAVGPAGQCSGLPAEVLETRKVLIYSPARSASQQGKAFDGTWKISFGDDGKRCARAIFLRAPAGLLVPTASY